MRSQWVPVSAAALVTGVMALVLGQTPNPSGMESSVSAQLVIAAESAGRWLTMSLFFFGATALVMGTPAVLTLFDRSRGRRVGTIGVALLAIGSVGVGGLSALTLMFQSLALQLVATPVDHGRPTRMVSAAMHDPGMIVTLDVWIYCFLLGVLLVAIGLCRSRSVPGWVPGFLVAFLALQVVTPLVGTGTGARVISSVGLVLLASGFTGIATHAVGLQGRRHVTHTLTDEAQLERVS